MDRKTVRRSAAGILIVAGALLLWLSPEAPLGVFTVLAGIALEAIGIRLDHA
jgi:hypothetical protein